MWNYQKELSLPCVEFFIDIVKSFASESQTQLLFSVNSNKRYLGHVLLAEISVVVFVSANCWQPSFKVHVF